MQNIAPRLALMGSVNNKQPTDACGQTAWTGNPSIAQYVHTELNTAQYKTPPPQKKLPDMLRRPEWD